MSKPPMALPEIDDDELKRRLAPLAAETLPPSQTRGEGRAPPPAPTGTLPAPAAAALPPPAKPPRKGIEFLLPAAVVTEIKTRAAQRGTSATLLLLELLEREGYPVTKADYVDLRRQPRR
jgi:hypothetical protein